MQTLVLANSQQKRLRRYCHNKQDNRDLNAFLRKKNPFPGKLYVRKVRI
jgi:hypothetical protein